MGSNPSSSSSSSFVSTTSTPPSLLTPPSPSDEITPTLPFDTGILIANCGEIALRIHRTFTRLNIPSIHVHTASHLAGPSLLSPTALTLSSAPGTAVPKSILLPGTTLQETYLSISALLAAAKETGARAIIPGYGFLSESPEFADACEENGITWIGPTGEQMWILGLKHSARKLVAELGIPLLPGSGLLKNVDEAVEEAAKIGYPVMVKSSAGGGGIGMRCCGSETELRREFESVKELGSRYFGDEDVFLEKFVGRARHVEVQIVGDGKGAVRHLGLRDCSLQRRRQKIIEETPAAFVPEDMGKRMCEAAVKLAESVNYRSVGTVEFLYDLESEKSYFLEVNTRLQVEHAITEEVTGIDLVEVMVQIAGGEADYLFEQEQKDIHIEGFAIEARIYGESPLQDFRPSTGQLLDVTFPRGDGVRVETHVTSGTIISPLYDALIAKIIVRGKDRPDVIRKLGEALDETKIVGIETNIEYLQQILQEDMFKNGTFTTTLLADFEFKSVTPVFEVLEPGPSTTIQDFPGRLGYWNIGVPPSGPMDSYAFRVANKMLGNYEDAAALECTFSGPTLLFHHDAIISIIEGGGTKCEINGIEVERKDLVRVSTGDQLRLGTIETGCRAYIAVKGGITVPKVFGSASTFALGKIGGNCGRELRKSDLIRFAKHSTEPSDKLAHPQEHFPGSKGSWHLRVMVGPHASPDFFDAKHFKDFFNEPWKVYYNSNRVGIRLTGPKPKWARNTGGEAGLHPSNIHDSPYSIGSISFTGDEAVILGCDGPSLGGFVVFATIITADFWKTGQMKAGDEVVLVPVSSAMAIIANEELNLSIEHSKYSQSHKTYWRADASTEAVLGDVGSEDCKILCRQAGDAAMLLEFGEDYFDIRNNARIYGIMHAHKQKPLPGVVELTPGVRSLLISYDVKLPQKLMLSILNTIVFSTSSTFLEKPIPSRIFHLPFAFEDSACRAAVGRYAETIRRDAPWLPDNVEFLRRINGLDTKNDVRDTMTNSTFLVLGLGDVFFGSPCAVPLDPRHRLFGMKYNPSRSFTAEGTVGIGGQYLCIYGIDSPGGYQLVGRTVPIWNRFAGNSQAWTFNVFDRISFYPASEAAVKKARDEGNFDKVVRITNEPFDVQEYMAWLDKHSEDIEVVRKDRSKALLESDAVVKASNSAPTPSYVGTQQREESLGVGEIALRAGVAGKCWKRVVEVGDVVESGQTLFVIEAMKMEIKIQTPWRATCSAIFANAGDILDGESWLATLQKM